MRILIALLMFAGSALANPITTLAVSGIGSIDSGGDLTSSATHPHFYLALAQEGSAFTGGCALAVGEAEYRMALPTATLAGSLLTGDFTGYEYVRLGYEDWVYYAIAGTFTEGVNFSAADQQGTIDITQATFLGRFAMAPEPSEVVFLLTGMGGIYVRINRQRIVRRGLSLRCGHRGC